MRLHRSDLNISAEFHQNFFAFFGKTFIFLCFRLFLIDFAQIFCPGLIRGCIRIFLVLFFLWKFLFWTLSIFKRGPDIRIFPTLSNFQNVNFIYTNFSRVRLDFIYSNAGWALFHANRSLFRIIWWNWRIMYNNYKIYYQYPPNPRTHRTQEPPNPRTTELRNHRF